MATNFIIASSGFILPENSYFKPFNPKDDITNSIFNRTIASTINSEILKFYQDKNVLRSEIINKAYKDYVSTKSFEDFINLIDICIDIFKYVDVSTFFKLQASNVNLSPISFKFCLDVVSGKFFNNYNDYAVVPFSIRFTINNGLTNDKAFENIRQLEKQSLINSNWEFLISELAENRDRFLVFFRYIFVDYY